jgi:hypothetical protein
LLLLCTTTFSIAFSSPTRLRWTFRCSSFGGPTKPPARHPPFHHLTYHLHIWGWTPSTSGTVFRRRDRLNARENSRERGRVLIKSNQAAGPPFCLGPHAMGLDHRVLFSQAPRVLPPWIGGCFDHSAYSESRVSVHVMLCFSCSRAGFR